MAHDVSEELKADIAFALPVRFQQCIAGEWVIEYVAGEELAVHPGPAWGGGHQVSEDLCVLGLEQLRGFRLRSDLLAVGGLASAHALTPVMSSTTF